MVRYSPTVDFGIFIFFDNFSTIRPVATSGNSYEEMLKNYIEENKEEEHTGTKKADTDAGKESIKDGFEKGSRVY